MALHRPDAVAVVSCIVKPSAVGVETQFGVPGWHADVAGSLRVVPYIGLPS